MEKAWAARAGLGWQGKHTNLITKDYGSWVFLGEVITDLDLEPDEPMADFCGTCTACIEACPTNAIVEPYVVDSNKCISYLTIEHKGEITPEHHPQLEQWVYGCDICQDVCPWNRKAEATADREFEPRDGFLNPELDILGSGYNVIQSIIAVGSGGILGRGFGHGTQSHLQFLPVFWTDFIFASFAEEWGYLGVVALLALYSLLLLSVLFVAYKTKNSFGSMVCIGVFSMLFFQFLINVGMNLGLMPVTGIPLPFVSYGGSSMVVSFLLLGLVQSVWIHNKNQ